MNRVKLWVFTVLVVALGYLLSHAASSARRADAVAALDARLASAAAHVTASTASVGRDAAAAAAAVARDEGFAASLRAPPPPAPPPKAKGKKAPPPPPLPRLDPAAEEARVRDAARDALGRAEKLQLLGFDLPRGTQVIAASPGTLARKADEGEVGGLLRGAAGGQAPRAIVKQGGALFSAAARPAGEGGAVVVLVPLDEAWARRLATAAGTDFTLAVTDVKPVTTTKGQDLVLLQGATKLAGAGDVGRPTSVDVSVGPLKLPPLPQPFAGGAPLRARAVALEGVKGGYVVASIPSGAVLNAPAAFHWRTVAGLVVLLIVGVVLGFFVRSTESVPQVPDALYAAAVKIEKGDFSARVPQLAGKLGTLGAALNRAAEIAGPALAARGAPIAPATTDEWYAAGNRGVGNDAAARAPTVASMSAAAPRGATLAAVAPPVTASGLEVDEETHWQQVFQDFLRTRSSCGEGTEGLTYEKFRLKLEGNKAQLVTKYACKTVRFQVYVKDGKAALKATPVK